MLKILNDYLNTVNKCFTLAELSNKISEDETAYLLQIVSCMLLRLLVHTGLMYQK